jgi:hypothetical protein
MRHGFHKTGVNGKLVLMRSLAVAGCALPRIVIRSSQRSTLFHLILHNLHPCCLVRSVKIVQVCAVLRLSTSLVVVLPQSLKKLGIPLY